MRQEELSREFEVLKEKGLAELVVWLRKNFDIKFSVTATASCPVCTVKAAQPYVKVAHPTDESGSSIHPAGFSKWGYNTCYDPNRLLLQHYEIWFSIDSPDALTSVAHEALHGRNCKAGNHGYCGDIS